MSPTRYPLANSLAQRSYSFEASEEDLDVDDKVEELMRLVKLVEGSVNQRDEPSRRELHLGGLLSWLYVLSVV